MVEINEVLKDLGLNEKEAEIYSALLLLGEEAASRISEIANLNRVTTYSLLKSLQEKGFCSVYIKNKTQYFKPIRPEQILSLFEEKKHKIKSILPLLKEKEKIIKEKPEISLFEGKKGIASLLDIILRDAEKEILVYGNFTKAEKVAEYLSLHFRKKRVEQKIKLKAILDAPNEEISNRMKIKEVKEITEIKLMKELENINVLVVITENIVACITANGELIGVLVKNKEILKKEKFHFELMWKKAKEYG